MQRASSNGGFPLHSVRSLASMLHDGANRFQNVFRLWLFSWVFSGCHIRPAGCSNKIATMRPLQSSNASMGKTLQTNRPSEQSSIRYESNCISKRPSTLLGGRTSSTGPATENAWSSLFLFRLSRSYRESTLLTTIRQTFIRDWEWKGTMSHCSRGIARPAFLVV